MVFQGDNFACACVRMIDGGFTGAVLGSGFHLVAGPTAIVIGQPNLQFQHVGELLLALLLRLLAHLLSPLPPLLHFLVACGCCLVFSWVGLGWLATVTAGC
jgi:hypothetical protein